MGRIIVVDDEKEILQLFELNLKRSKTREISIFDRSVDALEAIKAKSWDLLISDINMPEMDGFTLLRKARDLGKSFPCIMITAYCTDDNLKLSLESECFGYVNKPFDWNYLNVLVDNAIRSSRRVHGRRGQAGL